MKPKITTLIKRGLKKYPNLKWITGRIFRFGEDHKLCGACAIGYAILGCATDQELNQLLNPELDENVRWKFLRNKSYKAIIDVIWKTNDSSKSLEETIDKLKKQKL